MLDMGSIAAAATSLKAAADIAKTLGELKSISDVQGKVIELQSKILAAQSSALAAQSEQAAMLQRVSELEKEITRIKAWEEQKDRYKLENAWDQNPALVYKLKSSSKPAETAHWICAKCYDDGRRSILQPQQEKAGWITLFCATCKSDIHTGWRGIGAPDYAKE